MTKDESWIYKVKSLWETVPDTSSKYDITEGHVCPLLTLMISSMRCQYQYDLQHKVSVSVALRPIIYADPGRSAYLTFFGTVHRLNIS